MDTAVLALLSVMPLRIEQLPRILGQSLDQLWIAPGANNRRVRFVTHLANFDGLSHCQTGELAVLDTVLGQDALQSLPENWRSNDPACILIPTTAHSVDGTNQAQSMAATGRVSVGLLSLGTDPQLLATKLSRALASVGDETVVNSHLQAEETLQGVAEALGRLVGNSVTIETPSHDLLASSPTGSDVDQDRIETILHRHAAARIMNQPEFKEFFARVRASDSPLHFEADPRLGHSGRVAVRIAADGELYGVIWVTDTARPLGERDYAIIRQAADVAAAIKVRQQLSSRRDSMLRAELLDEVIKGRISNPENIRTIALSVGWNVDRLQQAMVVAIDEFEAFRLRHTHRNSAHLYRTQERLLELVRLEALAVDPDAVIGMRTSNVVVLLDVKREAEPDRKSGVMVLADSIVKRTSAFLTDMKVTVGVGRQFSSLEQMAESFRQAELAAELGQSLWGGNLALHYDELGIHQVLYSLRDTEGMITPPLQRIIAYDEKHGTDYVHTLWAYLKNMGRLRLAAEELHIHRNTLEYRIARIAELSGVDLDDSDSRLALELGIRVLQLSTGSIPGSKPTGEKTKD